MIPGCVSPPCDARLRGTAWALALWALALWALAFWARSAGYNSTPFRENSMHLPFLTICTSRPAPSCRLIINNTQWGSLTTVTHFFIAKTIPRLRPYMKDLCTHFIHRFRHRALTGPSLSIKQCVLKMFFKKNSIAAQIQELSDNSNEAKEYIDKTNGKHMKTNDLTYKTHEKHMKTMVLLIQPMEHKRTLWFCL